MAISSIDIQVKTAYEDLGMSPEDISVELQIDKSAVIYSLTNHSPAFRKLVRQADAAKTNEAQPNSVVDPYQDPTNPTVNQSSDLTPDDATEMLLIMRQIAQGSEDDNVRLRAAQFIYNEQKGRNSNVDQRIGSGLTLAQLNAGIRRAMELSQDFLHTKPVINIKPVEALSEGK